MAALTSQGPATRAGVALTFAAAAAGGDTAAPDTYLIVKNGGGSPITVTLTTPNTVYGGLTVQDPTVSVAAAAETVISLDREVFRNPSTGRVDIAYSGVTSVTVAVLAR